MTPAASPGADAERRGPLQWTLVVPVLTAMVLAGTWARHDHPAVLALIAVSLVGAVFAAVHHAEVVAHRVGEPFGSLILAVAVTVIEVGMIVMLMSGGGPQVSTYARDTVYAAVMITLNGIVGVSLLVGALRHRLVSFNASGSGSALATVITLAGVCLVLPGFTVSKKGLEYTGTQLAFAAVASLILYGGFVFTQTVRHRDFFVPVAVDRHGRESGLAADQPQPGLRLGDGLDRTDYPGDRTGDDLAAWFADARSGTDADRVVDVDGDRVGADPGPGPRLGAAGFGPSGSVGYLPFSLRTALGESSVRDRPLSVRRPA